MEDYKKCFYAAPELSEVVISTEIGFAQSPGDVFGSKLETWEREDI